ncbi:MAG: hypothetical protein DRH24_13520 [Deltaproteobacteria bacterium]|nr:MAG: hypothetical protein DRH24_13520 [Deltaproteobacteria bacterium]
MSRVLGIMRIDQSVDGLDIFNRMLTFIPHGLDEDSYRAHEELNDVVAGVINAKTSYMADIFKGNGMLVACIGYAPEWNSYFERKGVEGAGGYAERLALLYRRDGIAFLKDLPGFFSIVVYDSEEGKLLVAGDRSGYFPVYYAVLKDYLIFSSTIKAIKPFIDPVVVNRGACIEHLLFDAIYGRQTYYDDIEIIPFGSYLMFERHSARAEIRRYFAYEELFDIARYREMRGIDAPAFLSGKLEGALNRVLSFVGQSSLGLSCGGGIDCTYIGALLKRMGVELPIYCSNVVGSDVSEKVLAEESAGQVGTELYVSDLRREDFYPLILRSILEYEQPIVHPSTPKFYVSTDIKWSTGRRNLIMGVASDLLFGGIGNVNSLYRYLKLKKILNIVPARFKRILSTILSDPRSTNVQLRMRNKLWDLARIGMGNFERASMQERVERAFSSIPSEVEREVKILMVENLCDYQQHLLNRRYESNTSYGISLYFPFLDLDLLEFAINLPVSHCVDWKNGKVVVRKAASQLLGSSFYSRKKWGGDVPIDKWVPPLKFLLRGGFLEEFFSFESDQLIDAAGSSIKVLWNLIDLELWGRLSVLGQSPYKLIERMREEGIECSDYTDG